MFDTPAELSVEQPQDVTGSRSLATWETNTTGNPLNVEVTAFVSNGDASADDTFELAIDVNSSQTNNPIDIQRAQTSNGNFLRVTCDALVPDGGEYQARLRSDSSGSAQLDNWNEQEVST